MSGSDDSAEPPQLLPAGLPKGHAEYNPEDAPPSVQALTDVGGYDELLAVFKARGLELPRSEAGLAAVDDFIGSNVNGEQSAELARPIGMFYGDVLTHAVAGAHWEVVEDRFPLVRVTGKTTVDVVRIAQKRLVSEEPTLLQNFAHVLELRHDS
ncbi:DUF6278 family protein [Arthrobacter sp. CJ23]|uniref:DUF6278 family protein n=1 Tax=Arthrobacter sp. CJ23 TaxID=2972479 RepID=UPI00215D3AE0|nr:DUF6278 family protein [Arthrobacter sp. CJ23]UVJ39913.1 DUF6278 family protein [Arthrobacter sp. CJ23]